VSSRFRACSSVAQDAQPWPHHDDASTRRLMAKFSRAFAQFQREMMLERQRGGIAKAKAENRYLGRRPSARLNNDEAVKLFTEGER
jgi:DNA invertase Pin-like site-specific DNA recombinase